MNNSTLMNAIERKTRINEKRKTILSFMRDETWTHVSVLKELLGYKSVQAVYQTLSKMQRDHLVKRAEIKVVLGRAVTIWGITEMGLHFAFELDDVLEKRSVFEPSKIKPMMMQHKIDLQISRVRAERSGWTDWLPGELLGMRIKCNKYPDAIAVNPLGERIAIELERTIKSRKRYAEILVSHLMQRKQGSWDKIYYLSPDVELAARIHRAFLFVKNATHNGKKFDVTENHRKPFYFYSFNEDDWLNKGEK